MAGYISSNENRFYVSAEQSYGTAGAITAVNRIPAVQLRTSRRSDAAERRDKTGSRTYSGIPTAVRSRTKYSLITYMTSWPGTSMGPAYGPLFEAALGAPGRYSAGGTISGASGNTVSFSQPHGLVPGQAVSTVSEIRFVSATVNATTVVLNAPLSTSGRSTPTVTYSPATDLRSFSLFDYWSPDSAIHRILTGSGVDELHVRVNGDFQEFVFTGEAADLADSATFASGQAGLTQFPDEPATAGFDSTIVPGHLGQVWIGSAPDRFFTLTAGEVVLSNGLDLRAKEFGAAIARTLNGDMRDVSVDFTVFAQDDAATKALHQAARQRSPIPVMFQLGEQSGQLCGIYLPSVMLEPPEYDDSETRLQWTFRSGRAQGSVNDELFIAFA